MRQEKQGLSGSAESEKSRVQTHTCLKYIDPSPNFSDFPTSALVSVCFLHISVTLSGPPVKCWDIPKTDFDRLVSVRVRGLFVNSQD